ncbi:beta-1,3-galactosyltransferase 2 [Colossoma macropomum]|uniref:beta-1,3-galactosyltransferase 2 n=1 Tax=Colossoma macropomum TaxID=42526 RepID=UPI0018645956|nr:beta-1,3-galactosyltransferase 2 [Colossoma macropomum]
MLKSLRSRLLKYFLLGSAAGLISLLIFLLWNSSTSGLPSRSLAPLKDELYKVISPSTYRYILNQPKLCERRNPFVVFMIPVTGEDSESRSAIRKTWGQDNLLPNVDITRLFFIGQPSEPNPNLEKHLQKESNAYGDIIQMDFLDTYRNLTVKTMMIMNWLATYCPSAQYAMKVDADIFINVPYLVHYLQSQASQQDYITGSVINDGRPRRNPHSKWYLSEEVYPESSFPPYVSGAGYVFSIDLAKKISWASRFVRPIDMEDVYVGLCLHYLNVHPVFSRTLLPYKNLFEIRRLEYDRCTFAQRIIITGFTPSQLLNIWHDFQSAGLSC